jgi:CheY-like chemotaxis protein
MHSVLLVDDNADFRLIFQRKFADLGYQVLTVGDGVRGLQVVMEQPVDVILLDWNLPHRNGLETLRLIRSMKPEVPVVVITAFIDEAAWKMRAAWGLAMSFTNRWGSRPWLTLCAKSSG